MRLLVVRHAIAEDRSAFARRGRDDGERPLSKKGRRRFEAAAAALAALAGPIDLLVASPLLRARQTADLLARACDRPPRRAESGTLVPGAHPRELAEWLRSLPAQGAAPAPELVAVVGHQPHLGHLVSWLAGGNERSWIELKKGSAVLLDLAAAPGPGAANLLWALTPRQLRALAR